MQEPLAVPTEVAPYVNIGLQWALGAMSHEIKLFRELARQNCSEDTRISMEKSAAGTERLLKESVAAFAKLPDELRPDLSEYVGDAPVMP